MKRSALLFTMLLCCATATRSDTPKRPRILGIARVKIFTTDVPAARTFYTKVLNSARNCNWCEEPPAGLSFLVNSNQGMSLAKAPTPTPSNLIEEIIFATDNIAELRRYLAANKIAVSKPGKYNDRYLSVSDPEGHRIGFLQRSETPELTARQQESLEKFFPSGLRIIHAGFIVHDRAATEHFYKDILGFRPYWQGGMKDDQTDWVSMQVPDGTDWLEFMVNVERDADQRLRGIMNHIAIGVAEIKSETTRLRDEENIVPILEEPKIGRDGKWQLNLYDPDLTRVEFMEFTPVQKPCCSEFTGPHPGPQPPSKAPAKP